MALSRSPDIWLVAYFLSRCGQRRDNGRAPGPPPQLNVASWGEAYAQFFSHLGGGRAAEVFQHSLKNARDTFDGHHPSGRVGWREGETGRPPQPLGKEAQAVRDEWQARSDDDLWDAVRRFIGTPVQDAEAPIAPAPTASDLEPPPQRVQTTISRIVRDTQLAIWVKRKHNFRCQICGHTVLLADSSGYAEGHHVQPLGEPHNGPDIVANIICLCPNHHAACDLGAIRLNPGELRAADGHVVGPEFIDYHNRVIFRGGEPT